MNTHDRDRFVGAMIAEGFDPSPHHPKDLFEPAREFARSRAEARGPDLLVAQFRGGTYVELGGRARWFEGLSADEALGRRHGDPAT